jgi:hypothetical protein
LRQKDDEQKNADGGIDIFNRKAKYAKEEEGFSRDRAQRSTTRTGDAELRF